MELEGVVTNVANFGAFVDIGVHQDGLIHVSQLADRYVSDPKQIVKVGQVVKVRVLEVNEQLKRISLTMRSGEAPPAPKQEGQQKPKGSAPKSKEGDRSSHDKTNDKPEKPATLEDLKAKFGRKR